MGPNCNCKNRCFENVGEECCKRIFSDFYSISIKDLQDSYLYGLIKRCDVSRQRPRSGEGKTKASTFSYKVRALGKEHKICQKAFLSIHKITKSRLERLQKYLANGNVTAPTDHRGKHANRPNKIPDD
ncbi:unnamed protein product, partial [Psylliodes chrysocephalus]